MIWSGLIGITSAKSAKKINTLGLQMYVAYSAIALKFLIGTDSSSEKTVVHVCLPE